jgi:hypothetical protein
VVPTRTNAGPPEAAGVGRLHPATRVLPKFTLSLSSDPVNPRDFRVEQTLRVVGEGQGMLSVRLLLWTRGLASLPDG